MAAGTIFSAQRPLDRAVVNVSLPAAERGGVKRTCTQWGRITARVSGRCPLHPLPKRTRSWRGGKTGSSRAWRTTRERILARDGHRCTAYINGVRCPVTTNLQVHHLSSDGGVLIPDALLTSVCHHHHPRGS